MTGAPMNSSPTDSADVRQAYQVATNLYMQENSVTWARFNSMVAANAIIVAAIGVSASATHRLYLLALMLPVAGLALCRIWWRIMQRGLIYHDVWRASAYLIEKDGLNGIKTMEYGHQLRKRKELEVFAELRKRDVDLDLEKSEIPAGTAREYAHSVIRLFTVVYVIAILQVGWGIYATWSTDGLPGILSGTSRSPDRAGSVPSAK